MRNEKFTLLIFMILVVSTPSLAQDGDAGDAAGIFKNMIENYKELHDYIVDMTATMEMQGISVPEMKARIYFKRPDKVSIKSDDFMLIPKKGVVFDPSFFGLDTLDNSIFRFLTEKGSGDELIKKYSVRPDPDKADSMTVWLDPNKYVIRKIERNMNIGGKLLIEFKYILTDEFFLPSEVTVSMDIPQSLMNMKGNPFSGKNETLAEQIGGFREDAKGIIRVKYSNYIVNKGISDELFNKSPFMK